MTIHRRNIRRAGRLLGTVAYCGILAAGCNRLQHPKELSGVWHSGKDVLMTFGNNGQFALSGKTAPAAMVADLRSIGQWDASGGKLRLTARDNGAPEKTKEYPYKLDDAGQTLHIKAPGSGASYLFTRQSQQ